MKFSQFELIGIGVSIVVVAVVFGGLRYVPEDFSTAFGDSSAFRSEVVMLSAIDGEDDVVVEKALTEGSESGKIQTLIIQDILEGTGAEIEEGDVVMVHYIGSLVDGTIFDNSYQRGQPFAFTIGRSEVIKGWEKGLIGMREGGQRILVVPPHMAYGDQGSRTIPPGSALIFAIEVLTVN